jgi:hypothetical protein
LAWDGHGNKLYENHAADIACYALNVVNEKQVWFYFYTDFELGCISGGTSEPNVTFMNPNISGSSGFSTDGYHFLPGRLSKGHKIDLLNEDDKPFKQAPQDFRQHRLLLSEGNLLYQVTMEEITSASGLG